MAGYIDNGELEAEMLRWRDSAEDPDQRIPSERLGQLLMALHDGVLRHRNFSGYRQDLKDEMKSFSLYRVFKRGLRGWSPSRGTPFAYFTRSAFLNYATVLRRYYGRLNQNRKYAKGELSRIDTSGDPRLEWIIRHFGVED